MKKVGSKQDSTMKTKQTVPGSIFFSVAFFFKGRVIQPPKKKVTKSKFHFGNPWQDLELPSF